MTIVISIIIYIPIIVIKMLIVLLENYTVILVIK